MKVRPIHGYKYKLETTAVFYTDIYGYTITTDYISLTSDGLLTIEKGYCWDGATGIPNFACEELLKSVLKGSLVHDALYQLIRQGDIAEKEKEKADTLMYQQFLDDGLNKVAATMFYQAVRNFGEQYATKGENLNPQAFEV